jgi:hypothetical protein
MKTQTFKTSTSIIVLLFMLAVSLASCSEDEPAPKKQVTQDIQMQYTLVAQDNSRFIAVVADGVNSLQYSTSYKEMGGIVGGDHMAEGDTYFIKVDSNKPMKVAFTLSRKNVDGTWDTEQLGTYELTNNEVFTIKI